MSMFENFPWTNMHELNLGWIIQQLKKIENGGVLSVNGQTGEVTLYESDNMQLPSVDSNVWQIIRVCNDTVCGIHFNTDGNATIVNGNRLIQIYTADNPPPYPVTSVNGQTGDVELYQGHVVRLPSLTDEQLLNWNIYRLFNGVQSGIQFENDGTVKVIWGQNRYTVYTSNNPPVAPVTSVEGMTGDVVLFPEAEIQFNDITDPSQHNITWFSMLNNKMLGIEIDDTGRAYIWKDEDKIPLYMEGLNDPSDFANPTEPVLRIVNNVSTSTQWGIIRRVQNNDDVGFVIAFDPAQQEYKGYLMVNNSMYQLLTLADIPSQSGVVSVNSKTGVVELTGEDIPVSSEEDTDIDTAINLALSNIGIVENGDTATHAILENEYVIWKRRLYQARTSIAIDDVLSASNLASVTGGGLNQFEDIVDYSNSITWGAANITGPSPVGILQGMGRIRMMRVVFRPTTSIQNAWRTILTLPSEHWPSTYISTLAMVAANNPDPKTVRLTNAGVLEIYNPVGENFSINIMYIAGDY